MPDHVCPHTDTIKRLNKLLDGNGRPGVIQEVAEMRVKYDSMEESMKKMATALSGINRAREEEIAMQKERERFEKEQREKMEAEAKERERKQQRTARRWQIIATAASIMFGAFGVWEIIKNIS